MKRGFGFYVAYFPTHRLIYGAFASIPIFLVWIYLSWLVILLGALVTASIPAWRQGGMRQAAAPAERFEEALDVLKAFHDSLRTGDVLTVPLLGKRLRLGFEELEGVLETMERAQWVRKAAGEGWLLVRDLDQIRISEVYRCFVYRHAGRPGKPSDERVDALLGELEARVGAVLDLSLKQLFAAPRAIDSKRTG
jgi:membrane protein